MHILLTHLRSDNEGNWMQPPLLYPIRGRSGNLENGGAPCTEARRVGQTCQTCSLFGNLTTQDVNHTVAPLVASCGTLPWIPCMHALGGMQTDISLEFSVSASAQRASCASILTARCESSISVGLFRPHVTYDVANCY